MIDSPVLEYRIRRRAPTRRQRGAIWFWALLAVVVFAVGLYAGITLLAPPASSQPPDIGGVYVEEPLALVDFELVGDDGATFDADDLLGRWTFIYFGYTFCPDACPLTLAQLDKAQDLLAADDAERERENAYLLISVDPARDTPQRLAEYVDSFDPKFRGATGERAQIDALTDSLGIYYQINEPEAGKDYYLVDHSSALVLINPDARVQAILTPPFTPQSLAQDLTDIKTRYAR